MTIELAFGASEARLEYLESSQLKQVQRAFGDDDAISKMGEKKKLDEVIKVRRVARATCASVSVLPSSPTHAHRHKLAGPT